MPPVELANAWRIVLEYSRTDGDQVQNVFHVNGAPADAAELQVLADAAIAEWDTSNWVPQLRQTTDLTKVVVSDLNPGNPVTAEATRAFVGGSGGTGIPPEIAAVITLRTGLRGRSFRGRTFIGPLAESMINSDGEIDLGVTTGQGLLLQFFQYWTNLQSVDTGSGTHTLMVASFTLGRITPVEKIELDDQVDHQQSRATAGDTIISQDMTPTNPGT